ncbi:MAG: peptide chain release factor N(5)-glutamine methyltransferase [Desulfobacterium sp.]|nr:peptide chain release factor N(5)-glutamine methyltransferase [Desulfobacterium sp.]MBU3949457.1 peptide chain release factor N(5)-glutamine methyltransferase [Pseudomonadota bacterium]MBU4010838.1 peptide chain release factor N(5)-glutamine methyltransferase [Pseudomonadota bacterium]MBU4036023.1 peptide chain release factor N(5)-glutamine methyltransferase [Pseudomonadota bacterium]
MQNRQNPIDPEWTIIKILQWTTSYFKTNEIDSPRSTAEIILAHALGLKRIDLYLRHDQPLNIKERNHFKSLIKRRINNEPVAYIVGNKEFWSIELTVSKDVLIPRPETECLVEEAFLAFARDKDSASKKILDLGTGSGAIVFALATHASDNHYFASDISSKALAVALKNAKHLGLDKKINFVCGSWFLPIKEKNNLFDIIISNPPYIRRCDIKTLQPEINRFEPITALDGGEDGLGCIKHIVKYAHKFLNNSGELLLEIGYDQKKAVDEIIKETGKYELAYFRKDYSGFDRVVCAKKAYD